MEYVTDNVLVAQTDTHNEFFAIRFRKYHPDYQYTVGIGRHIVPGRLDVYDFDYSPMKSGFGDRVRYFSDTGMDMPTALKMLAKDLNRKNVLEMIENLATQRRHNAFRRDLTHGLLRYVAPKSKIYKMLLLEEEANTRIY